jgi:hypothetical protein
MNCNLVAYVLMEGVREFWKIWDHKKVEKITSKWVYLVLETFYNFFNFEKKKSNDWTQMVNEVHLSIIFLKESEFDS